MKNGVLKVLCLSIVVVNIMAEIVFVIGEFIVTSDMDKVDQYNGR